MLLKSLLFLSFFLLLSSQKADILLQLTDGDFDAKLQESDFSLILFYTTLCSHSSEIVSNMTEVYTQYYTQKKANISFYLLDISKNKKTAQILNITGHPVLKFYSRIEKVFKNWDMDYNKRELKYFIDLYVFHEITYYENSDKYENSKRKFQILMIGDLDKFKPVHQTLIKMAEKYYLYNFGVIKPDQHIYEKLFIPDKFAKTRCYLILFRRFDNFDKRIIITKENMDNFEETFEKFYQTYSHPYYINQFDQRIRKFLIENEIIAASLFYRKRTSLYDKFLVSGFKNLTRNFVLAVKNKEELPDYFNIKKLVFMLLDSEDPMTKRLSFFLHLKEEDMPTAFAFKFVKQRKNIIRYKLKDIQEMSSFYLLVTLSSFFDRDYSSPLSMSRSSGSFTRSPSSKVMEIAPSSESAVLRTRHPNYKTIVFIFEYAANFCIHSKKLSLVMDKLSQRVSKKFASDVFLLFGRVSLYGADAYDLVDKVPMVRVLTNPDNKDEYEELKLDKLEEEYIWGQIEEIVNRKIGKKEEL